MKFYHFGLVFAIIAAGCFVTIQLRQLSVTEREKLRRNEYDCLVAAVEAAVEAAFTGEENEVSEENLKQTEEVFFQTLSVLHGGTPDGVQGGREYVPCILVLEERGYYIYCAAAGRGSSWSKLTPYRHDDLDGVLMETETIITRYCTSHYINERNYCMAAAQRGIWEQGLSKACVFAVYAPPVAKIAGTEEGMLLYAAAGRTRTIYYVTEDKVCHVPSCDLLREEAVVALYTTQKESAQDGAYPCMKCLKERKQLYFDN